MGNLWKNLKTLCRELIIWRVFILVKLGTLWPNMAIIFYSQVLGHCTYVSFMGIDKCSRTTTWTRQMNVLRWDISLNQDGDVRGHGYQTLFDISGLLEGGKSNALLLKLVNIFHHFPTNFSWVRMEKISQSASSAFLMSTSLIYSSLNLLFLKRSEGPGLAHFWEFFTSKGFMFTQSQGYLFTRTYPQSQECKKRIVFLMVYCKQYFSLFTTKLMWMDSLVIRQASPRWRIRVQLLKSDTWHVQLPVCTRNGWESARSRKKRSSSRRSTHWGSSSPL